MKLKKMLVCNLGPFRVTEFSEYPFEDGTDALKTVPKLVVLQLLVTTEW